MNRVGTRSEHGYRPASESPATGQRSPLYGDRPRGRGECADRRRIPDESELEYGYFFQPTILDNVTPSMRVVREEIVGPVVSVIEVKSFEESIEILNNTSYGLSSSIYTRDVNRAFQAMRDIEAEITYINGPTIGAEVHLPFGGVKQTGNGHREAESSVLDMFSEWKTVYVDFSGRLQRARIDNRE